MFEKCATFFHVSLHVTISAIPDFQHDVQECFATDARLTQTQPEKLILDKLSHSLSHFLPVTDEWFDRFHPKWEVDAEFITPLPLFIST